MPLLGARDLVKAYGDREILAGASLAIEPGERLGLVGINGSGKSTLTRILAGLLAPDGGEITIARGARLAYLEQEPQLAPEATAAQVALAGLTEWSAAMARYDQASAAIEAGDANLDRQLKEQADAAAVIERKGGWEVRYQAETILGHLGIANPDQRIAAMSGGERRRVALAQLLVARPDLAILDEPTNHLDIATIEWLEQYLLERFSGTLLLITHDRYLLDRVVTRTLELDAGVLYSYDGGWDAYLAAKVERDAQAERMEANRRNFLRRELEWLRRQPKARTTKSKSRVQRAEQVLAIEGPTRTGAAAMAAGALRSGKTILETRSLAVKIGGQTLVDDLTLTMNKGDRIGVVGKNGAGKTTLLRTLLGEMEPAAGSVTRGQKTVIAYLSQSRAGLNDAASVYDNVAEGRSEVSLGSQRLPVRTYLQRFLFTVPEQDRAVATLSGGERARVALARVFRESSNLVVLDEPTNDLDVTTLAALEAALLDFGGSALVVTHDRWFLDRIATSILAFEDRGRVVHVHGNYQDYLRWREKDRAEAAAGGTAAPTASGSASRAAPPRPEEPANTPGLAEGGPAKGGKKLTFTERHELEGLMERIDQAEARVSELEAEVAAPSFAKLAHTEQTDLANRLAQARQEAESLVERWSELEGRSDIE